MDDLAPTGLLVARVEESGDFLYWFRRPLRIHHHLITLASPTISDHRRTEPAESTQQLSFFNFFIIPHPPPNATSPDPQLFTLPIDVESYNASLRLIAAAPFVFIHSRFRFGIKHCCAQSLCRVVKNCVAVAPISFTPVSSCLFWWFFLLSCLSVVYIYCSTALRVVYNFFCFVLCCRVRSEGEELIIRLDVQEQQQ